MKLAELKIENFRSFEKETIHFGDYTCFVGPNGSGKSTVLMALNVFFRENEATVTDVCTLSEEDFHHKNTGSPIRITATFEDLPAAAQEEFKHYYRQGKLVVSAEASWDAQSSSAPVKHYGSRLVMNEFAPFFDAANDGKKVPELRDVYAQIREGFSDLPSASTKTAMTDALRDYEENHPDKCTLVPEPNQFYGFTKGAYHLENYIQWVYVPAVKDASTEQEEGNKTALGQLLARTVRTKLDFSQAMEELKEKAEKTYTEILQKQAGALKGLGLSMEKRLQEYIDARARLDIQWHYDSKSSISIRDPVARAFIGDGDFIGEIARAGHGLQRGFLVTILHELVGNDDKGGPKLLLGFEEPELYQHPPQARHLADVLERLANPTNNSQVLVTTHSPCFVSTRGFENVRMVRKERSGRLTKVHSATFSQLEERLSKSLGGKPGSPNSLMARIAQIMQPSQNELFFTSFAVLVEGQEDMAFISTHLGLTEQLSRFRMLGCHFVSAGGKTNLSRLIAIAQELAIPHFVVFDADGDENNEKARKKNEKDNRCLLNLCGMEDSEPFPQEIVWGQGITVWPKNIQKSICEDLGDGVWSAALTAAKNIHDLQEGVKAKNSMLIAYTLEQLATQKKQSAVLIKLCANILSYAEKAQLGRAKQVHT